MDQHDLKRVTKKNFTHTVPGVIGTRKSPRVYTHATVVTFDPSWYHTNRSPQDLKGAAGRAGSHWSYFRSELDNEVANRAKALREDAAFTAKLSDKTLYPNASSEPSTISIDSHERVLAMAREEIAKHPTLESAQADAIKAEQARLDAKYAEGTHRFVESWHQSLRAAQAFASTLAGKHYYAKVEVLETVRS